MLRFHDSTQKFEFQKVGYSGIWQNTIIDYPYDTTVSFLLNANAESNITEFEAIKIDIVNRDINILQVIDLFGDYTITKTSKQYSRQGNLIGDSFLLRGLYYFRIKQANEDEWFSDIFCLLGEPAQPIPYIYLQTEDAPGTVGITVNNTAGSVISVDWGDGSAVENFTLNVEKTHVYAAGQEYNITISGDIVGLTKLQADNSKIVSVDISDIDLVNIDLQLFGNANLTTLITNNNDNTYSKLYLYQTGFELIDFSYLRSNNGDFRMYSCTALVGIYNLIGTFSQFYCYSNSLLATLEFQNYANTISGALLLYSNIVIVNYDFSYATITTTQFDFYSCTLLQNITFKNATNTVTTRMYGYSNPALTAFNSLYITYSACDFRMYSCTNLVSITNLKGAFNNLLTYSNSNLTTITFQNYANTSTNFFHFYSCPILLSIDFIYLTFNNANLQGYSCTILEYIYNLKGSLTTFWFSNTKLTSIDFVNVTNVTLIYAHDMSLLTEFKNITSNGLTSLRIYNNPNLTDFDFNLVYNNCVIQAYNTKLSSFKNLMSGSINGCDLSSNNYLVEVDCNNVTLNGIINFRDSINIATIINLNGQPSSLWTRGGLFTSIDLLNITCVNLNLQLIDNINLISILNIAGSLTTFWFFSTLVKALDITNVTNITNFQCQNNALSAAEINQFLIDLDAKAYFATGDTFIGNGTNAAPTGAGATAKTSLQGKGATITTN